MKLSELISEDIKKAMKARETDKLSALRDIKSKILLEQTSGNNKELSEEVENKIILKLYKQRMDTYAIYVEQGRNDLAEEELLQAKIIESYMPKMLTEDEIRKEAQDLITALGASGPSHMGKVMGALTKKLAGKADGKMVSSIVKDLLNN